MAIYCYSWSSYQNNSRVNLCQWMKSVSLACAKQVVLHSQAAIFTALFLDAVLRDVLFSSKLTIVSLSYICLYQFTVCCYFCHLFDGYCFKSFGSQPHPSHLQGKSTLLYIVPYVTSSLFLFQLFRISAILCANVSFSLEIIRCLVTTQKGTIPFKMENTCVI